MLGIIINPKSGKKYFRAQRIYLWHLLRSRHQPFAYRVTKFAGHAIELARELVEKGYDEILILGGRLSTYFVQNASFLRCDNITVGYSFAPKTTTLNGRVYCTVSNPFVISGYKGLDPEIFGGIDNNIYPRSMTTLIGASVQF